MEILPDGSEIALASDATTPVYQINEPNVIPASVDEIIEKHQPLFQCIGKFNKSEINFDIRVDKTNRTKGTPGTVSWCNVVIPCLIPA